MKEKYYYYQYKRRIMIYSTLRHNLFYGYCFSTLCAFVVQELSLARISGALHIEAIKFSANVFFQL